MTNLSPTEQAAFDRAAAPAAADLNGESAPAQGPPCGRCGHPLPPLPPELQKIIDAGQSVALMHEPGTCPGDAKPEPEGKYYEVRVQVVRVDEAVPVDEPSPFDPEHTTVVELLSFVAGHRAPNLPEAMRPLALALGEKWAQGEKNAGIAEAPE